MSWPTPSWSSVWNGSSGSSFFFRYSGTKEPMSSRLKPKRHLRQVVRAEAEELRRLGHLVGRQRRARQLDHRADQVVELLELVLRLHLDDDAVNDLLLVVEFGLGAGDRDHDLRQDVLDLLVERHFGGGFEDGADLVLGDFRIGDAEADAAVSHHRVGLVQALGALLEFLHRDAERVGQFLAGGRGPSGRTRGAAGRACGSSPDGPASPPSWPSCRPS